MCSARLKHVLTGSVCFVAMCAATVTNVSAQILPPALHSVSVRAMLSGVGSNSSSGATPRNVAGDWSGVWDPDGDQHAYSMQGTAETLGGFRPEAAVQAEVSQGATLAFQVVSDASIEYYVRIRPLGNPPPGNYGVPAIVNVRGDASGEAYSQARIGYLPPVQVSTLTGYASYDTNLRVSFFPSDPILNVVQVRLRAIATGNSPHTPWRAQSSQAYADPLFTFDQAAFDTQMGANTFALAEYFEFEYSEWLLNPPGMPVIVTQPVSQSLCQGGEVTLTTAATSDAPLTYQWQWNGSPLSDFGAFSGTTTPTLTILPAMGFDSGQYDCVITNVAGSVTTNAALVTVDTPALVFYPPQPVTVATGQPMAMTVYTQGSGPINYQWRRNGENLVDDGRIGGATTADLVIDPTMLADAGTYDVIVSNMCGSMTSDAAELVVTGCAADFNADTAVDFFDYLDFVAAFSGNEPVADFNADTAIDFFDYLDFVAAFSSGC